ncbi:class I SAM-dependent methyltransferase [Erythrobacter sp. HL-111]|uniref:class I SAM-dependent methyltransferase n=1 Tax=Erythrobacter sp. HL-111 TaxID=1798193 RepID=UPI0006DB7CAE|nr:class I SAM-dependent methyltransferase [Erythrobacter sp. HL-111]KPP93368.1 MAG: 23S rRNA (cytosine1962-C5)-methyltransferase RlmI [Erythrobacteraceae bacterium HL-111]SDR71724.1 23S rRNA (cytosine1962-C5)-methyltransferase [Erythrobacter sp. HL-111]
MAQLAPAPLVMECHGWDAYRLIDSGAGRKLEAFGPHAFIRPEPQALWRPRLADWRAAGEFVPGSDEDGGGRWDFGEDLPEEGWHLAWNEVRFTARPTPFRHLQFFPDMAVVWDWMRAQLSGREDAATLNLFGYTGLGTLALSRHGSVTHVDASKKSVAQARDNAALSGMEDRPIRWLVDDAAKFTAREVRRERRYDGIILDPPKFGRGPKNETWRLEEGLAPLVHDCARLLDADSRFLFLTVYAVRMSSLALAGLLEEALVHLPGGIEHGDLAVIEEPAGDAPRRRLPTAIFARWSNPG